ncbi:peptidylprolyl isomerase [Methanosarcina sp. 2.H.T.1A.6]|uniref:peptidylprolyl isomerase n=1 Tax=unclassified Methanosarcina TaxID=2644672 RepID=UPI0006221359|nr:MULTISPECIES: peptidylprolyl isomerase [unclassified Methanosarcina]KKG14970.1 peptidylprolyl isomerase [Methanosarcina sp. 2.H.T.1A.3]KKG16447.1 peptidylprolyl isomerase [Methanosarcina sp. 2.H.T.1A.15]KKG20577.1 peptidylprolyl isomerase [Methanosarcina sp. 2.H.T.1A.8]KKG21986.1 peptidylprolyl isomerase [Methanosarcina sp. 2.H.T.1A.6]
MAIQKGDFIKLNYTGRFEDGRIFDTTDEELAKKEEIYNPRGLYGGDVVIVGAGHTIDGLDEDLEGKEDGYSGTVSIPPEKAFGPSNPSLVETVSITKLPDRNVHPGMPVELDGRRGVVSRVIGRRVTVDFNSPLAGKTVSYEYTIEKILENDVEKIQGILALYTGIRDTEVEIADGVAKINVPTGLTFNQRWLMAKNRVASELFKYAGLTEVQLIEKLTAEAEVPAPAEPEVETEAETEVKEETSESQE